MASLREARPSGDADAVLGRADFFSICDAEQRRLLATAAEKKRWRPGSTLYQAGEAPIGAHVLIYGTVAAYQAIDEVTPYVVATPGAVLGAISLFIETPRAVSLKAIDLVETLVVPRAAFLALAAEAPDLAARAAARIRAELADYLHAIERIAETPH